MSQEKTTLEVIAPTVDDAVQKGLAQLNLPQDAVEVEVLDAGSRGLFGLGSRQARIRLTIKPRSEAPAPYRAAPEKVASVASRPAPEPRPVEAPLPEDVLPAAEAGEQAAAADEDETLRVSRQVVTDL